MNTYTKLRSGNWGVRSTTAITTGVALVSKKNGETKLETIGRLVWSGNGVWLYTIVSDSPRGSSSRGRWTGCSCGSIEDHPRGSDCASCRHDY